jgi:hypothetical protein
MNNKRKMKKKKAWTIPLNLAGDSFPLAHKETLSN